MPDRAYTVNPVYSENGLGEEYIADLSVVPSGHSGAVGRDGQVRNWETDYYTDAQDQMHHRFENVELESDNGPSTFNEDAYIEAIHESYPQLTDAVAWAADNLPQEWIDEYNAKIDSDDLDDLHSAVEWMLQQYAEYGDVDADNILEEIEADVEMAELSEEETEILNNVVEELQSSEPTPEYVSEWNDAYDVAVEAGDETFAQVAQVTALFHAGEMSGEEAIDYCLNHCDLKELSRVYNYIQSNQ